MVKTAWALLLLLALMLTAPAGAEPLAAKTPVRYYDWITKSGWPKETRGFVNPYGGLTLKQHVHWLFSIGDWQLIGHWQFEIPAPNQRMVLRQFRDRL